MQNKKKNTTWFLCHKNWYNKPRHMGIWKAIEPMLYRFPCQAEAATWAVSKAIESIVYRVDGGPHNFVKT